MVLLSRLLFVLSFYLLSLQAWSFFGEGEWSGQGETAFQYRAFEDDNNNSTQDIGLAIFTRLESQYEGESSRHVFRGFGRVDEKDKDRDLIRLEDAYFSWRLGPEQSWKFLVGYKIFNWTATEAFHPADMVNSRNYDSDLENLEKMGEFTVELEKEFDLGTFSLYLWPQFEEPFFPGNRSRLGVDSGFTLARAKVVQGSEVKERRIMQYGTRLSLALDFMDLSFHAMRQVDRYFPLFGTKDFAFVPVTKATPLGIAPTSSDFSAHYFMKTQYGLTAQIPWNGFNFKFEGAYRVFDNDLTFLTARGLRTTSDHTDTAAGVDYTMNFDNGAETIFLFEVSSIFGVSRDARAELSTFQKDALIGFRHSFGDVMGSELIMTFIKDIERDNEKLLNISFTRRLSDSWKFNTGIRIYDAPVKTTLATGLEFLDQADHAFFNLSRYF
jgi:hypothetical protein